MQKSPNNLLVSDTVREHLLEYLFDKFGIDKDLFKNNIFIKRGEAIWLCSENIDITFLKLVDFERVGIRMVRYTDDLFKPTTYFFQMYSKYITKNVLEISKEELPLFFNREEIATDKALDKGYVAIAFEGKVLGCAKYRDGVVFSEFPKKISNHMKMSQLTASS